MNFSFSSQHNLVNFLECDDLSYCSLMELFEDNYFLLKNILRSEKDFYISDDAKTKVHFRCVEKHKYTSIYTLTISGENYFNFKQQSKYKLSLGKFTLRVYHDARSVEADLSDKNRSHSQNIKRNWFINAYINECLKSINVMTVDKRKVEKVTAL